ncbi:TonB-dependent receptor [Porphyromonas pogonae]|uniref:SusC/RagA family TonB-linked outer membrane protein n=1 Tax=Porphyromonas pogonae TaxID=867595 RepID=UPI002E78A741|nr:TonB-dependent receptor [Porphyromonas pogonae]
MKKLLRHGMRLYLILLMTLSSVSAFAQSTITVKGTVTDGQKEPLIGVSVRVKGTTNGANTDVDGKFTITNVKPNATLEFSYIGMKNLEVAINGKTTINVVMEDNAKMLQEVVVVGYGTQKKVNVTGAVSQVDSKVFEARPVNNVSQALQGVIPGLNLSTTNAGGTLNSSMSINIRGVGTIGQGSNSSPLILIDGVQGDLNSLNPNDIKTFTVLKDAASCAIYGARASFGVILVTTKSGMNGKAKVNYSTNMRFSKASQIPEMMDSYHFARYFNEAAKNGGQGAVFSDTALKEIQNYMDWQSGKIKEPQPFTFAGNDNRWLMYGGSRANTNWFKEMYKSWVPSYEHNISVRGGSDKINYSVSGSYLDANGLIRHGKDQMNRYTLSGKIGFDITDWAHLDYNTRWIQESYSRPSYMTGLFFHNIARRWPTNPVYDPNGHYMEGNEILQMENGGKDKNEKDWLYQTLALNLRPLEGWNINAEFNYVTTNNFNHWDKLPTYGYDVDNHEFAAPWAGGDAGKSEVSESAVKTKYWTANVYSDYSKAIGGHFFKILAGSNVELMRSRDLGITKKDLITPLVPSINTATNDKPSVWGGYGDWSIVGFFARFNYNYNEKYLFEANVRRDGSSRFVGDKTWGTFPSFSAGWNIAKEDFFTPLSEYVSTLKLRASWGELGNMNTNALYPFFLSMPVGTANGSWLVDNAKPNTSSAPGIVSSEMTWEKIRSWNIGLDWSAFNSRLTGSFDYFKRTTKDMIGPAPELSSLLGTGVPRVNNADMESYGWEMQVEWRDQLGDFSYGAKLVLSDDQQRVTRYPNENYSLDSWYNGRKNGELWGYTTAGIAKTDNEIIEHLKKNKPSWGSKWSAGDVMYKDMNGDGEVNSGKNTLNDHGDLTVIGNSTPRYKYGITLDAAWKGIDLRVFLQGVGKRDYVLGGPYFWGASGGMWQSAGFTKHWDFFRAEGHELGANTDAYYPRPIFGDGKNQATQTKYLQDASYLRLKNIQLGYSLPQAWVSKLYMQNLRIYISGDNLFTKSKISGIFDPELLGGDWGPGKIYPLSKVISLGVNVNF